jgi:hypothetical protein
VEKVRTVYDGASVAVERLCRNFTCTTSPAVGICGKEISFSLVPLNTVLIPFDAVKSTCYEILLKAMKHYKITTCAVVCG